MPGTVRSMRTMCIVTARGAVSVRVMCVTPRNGWSTISLAAASRRPHIRHSHTISSRSVRSLDTSARIVVIMGPVLFPPKSAQSRRPLRFIGSVSERARLQGPREHRDAVDVAQVDGHVGGGVYVHLAEKLQPA